MEFGKAFTFAFDDREWLKKLLIAGLITLIPIIGQITVLGWSLEITKRVINHDPEPLPDWSGFGDYLVRGLKMFVVSLVYMLPLILLSICFSIPAGMAGDNNSDMQSVISILSICFSCVIVLYSIAASVLLIPAFGRLAATGDISSAFRFGEVIALLRANPGAFVIALIGVLISGVLASLGLILCVIGVIFTQAWAMAINGHLYGQAYNAATRNQSGGAQAF
jgi:hypothetical protein